MSDGRARPRAVETYRRAYVLTHGAGRSGCTHPVLVSGEAKVVVRDIDPGVYAVQAFHDENGNFDLDRNFLGLPKEGMGFSNDAPMRFGPPSFDDAAIEIGAAGAATRLRLRYFD